MAGRSPGGGHGNPLQYSCLENPMDRGDWWASETEESIGWQKVRYNWSNLARTDAGIHRVIRHQALRHSETTSGMTVKEKKVQTQAFFDTPCLWESSPHLPTGRCLFFSPPLGWYSLFPSLRSKRYGRTCLWSEPIFKKLFWLPWHLLFSYAASAWAWYKSPLIKHLEASLWNGAKATWIPCSFLGAGPKVSAEHQASRLPNPGRAQPRVEALAKGRPDLCQSEAESELLIRNPRSHNVKTLSCHSLARIPSPALLPTSTPLAGSASLCGKHSLGHGNIFPSPTALGWVGGGGGDLGSFSARPLGLLWASCLFAATGNGLNHSWHLELSNTAGSHGWMRITTLGSACLVTHKSTWIPNPGPSPRGG